MVRQHWNTASTTVPLVTIANTYIYDHMNRKTYTGEQIYTGSNTPPPITYLTFLQYNELGQPMTKHYHSTDQVNYINAVGYTYNERGWLTGINPVPSGGNFGETISYNNPTGTAKPQYNGNISQFVYNSPYMESNNGFSLGAYNTVNYSYDKLNRLLQSQSSVGVTDETVSYDLMGNITALSRTSGSRMATINTTNYAYTYSSGTNQLASVTGNGSAFRSYGYDGNGNATSDGGSKLIAYNIFNLPQSVTQSGTTIDTYTYDAAGQKLRNVSSTNGSWDYINGIVYLNGTLSFIQTEEGRAIPAGTNAFTYNYDLKDQLGNVRASFDNGNSGGTTRLVQENDYYPFGLTTKYYDLSNGNRYLYNNKEQQLDLTNQDDYGHRYYDAVIGRWTSVDPLAEQYRRWSDYNYGDDNPIRNIDPDGMGLYDKILLNTKGVEISRVKENAPDQYYMA